MPFLEIAFDEKSQVLDEGRQATSVGWMAPPPRV